MTAIQLLLYLYIRVLRGVRFWPRRWDQNWL